jgi:N-acetylneuraminate synthase
MTKPFIEISHRKIGEDYPPLVIAEIGINHNGSLDIALDMVDAAHRAGIEVVKHQTHIVEDEMSKEARNVIPGNSDMSIYEIMESCALNEADEIKLKEYVDSKGMIFISTPFSRAAANRLQKMEVSAYKVGSGECNNYPLLNHIASFGKPIILSTGMNDIKSIRKAVQVFNRHKIKFALLHTTNLYPTPSHLVRLGAMQEIQKEFPNVVVGLSDHTVSNLACFASVALGASILERHFTDTMDRNGPDIVNSMDEVGAQELVQGSKEIWNMRGGEKKATKEEQVTINFAFATVVSIKKIEKGEVLSEENIWVKRPGTGEIKAEFFESLLGRKVIKDLDCDEHLCWDDISE